NWWTPGPTKRLTLDTAQMVVEATHPTTGGVEITATTAIPGKEPRGFQFSERWPDGSAEAILLQGADYRLYLLRAKTRGAADLSPLMQQIYRTFRVE
ncbi:MAG: hypothetical protein D6793_03495, partial [Thermoflexia bacterium]